MATIKVLLGIIWVVAVCSSWSAHSNSLVNGFSTHSIDTGSRNDHEEKRKRIVSIAQKELGVHETTENSGVRVDQYNSYVGVEKVAWCASFVSWCFGDAGYSKPRTAWSPALFPSDRLAKAPLPGMVFGIYFPHLKRIAHCGIVSQVKNDLVFSVEGNTNLTGSREGTGVFRRIRHMRSIYRFSDWTTRNSLKP